MKVRDVLKRLKKEGWTLADQRGSHMKFVHPDFAEPIIVVKHADESEDIPRGTYHNIAKKAGWK